MLRASVVIPVGDPVTLWIQLEAVCQQEYESPFEVIIADNKLSPQTFAITESARRVFKVPVIYVDASARIGAGAARNIGAGLARGEYLAFCDADDLVCPGWLALMVDALNCADLVGGTDLFWGNLPNERHLDYRWNSAARSHLDVLPYARAGNSAFRKEVFLALGGYDERFVRGHDVELAWRAQLAGFRIRPVHAARVRYRARETISGRIAQAFVWGLMKSRALRNDLPLTKAFLRPETLSSEHSAKFAGRLLGLLVRRS